MLKSDELKAERKKLLDRNEQLVVEVEKRELTAEEDKEFDSNAVAIEDYNNQIAQAERKEWIELQKQPVEKRSINHVPYVKVSKKSDPALDEAKFLSAFLNGKGEGYLSEKFGVDFKSGS